MGKTERIQYQEVALAITGAWQGSCRSKLYEELGWESLSERRWCRRILQIHKIVSDKTPSYLKNKLPRLRRPLYRQSTSNTFQELKCKSLPTQLLLGIMLLLILMIFHLLVFLKTICIFWYTWFFKTSVPLPTKIGIQLLKISQKCHNFSDTHSDKCLCDQGVEDTNHFLFLWPFYCYSKSNLSD